MNDIYARHGKNIHFDHVVLLTYLAKWMRPVNYVELGIMDGSVFRQIAPYCLRATAVDIIPRNFDLPDNGTYFMGTTDEFFRQLDISTRFDMIFIDADHSHEQSLKDFMNARHFLVEDGIIVLHDTYPFDAEYLAPNLCSEAYKTALYIKNHMANEFESVTLPFPPGATIVRKIQRNKQVKWL